MLWRFFRKDELLTAGEVARRVHSVWLTDAMRSTRSYPRIPLKPVAAGGFSELMSSSDGPRVARDWWDSALQSVDDLSDGSLDGGHR